MNTLQIDSIYTYETVTNNNETYYTGRIKSLEYKNGNNQIIKYVYTYDDYNNITNIEGYENNVLVYTEMNIYTTFNQLNYQEITIDGVWYYSGYAYDSQGNVSTYEVGSTTENIYMAYFTYNQNNEVVSINDGTNEYNISYSSTGQPSSYMGYTIGYNLRNIISLTKGTNNINYTYNASDIRTSKTIDSNHVVNYTLDGTKILKETHTGSSSYEIEYYYDSNDNIIGFTYNNNKYMYLKNLQNDIIGLLDASGNVVVKYYYEGYGKLIHLEDTSGINLANINPFRYKSYYYDSETGWYYLNSRYYDTIASRFVTMDQVEYLGATGTIQSLNLFTYCEGNPVNYIDPKGNLAYPGEIHNAVVKEIARRYGFAMNVGIIYTNRLIYCDLMSSDGQIWEVKSCTLSFTKALNQLGKYLEGKMHFQSKINKNLFAYLESGYVNGGYLPGDTFPVTTKSGFYDVTYWYADQGIIYYSYEKRKNKEYNSIEQSKVSSLVGTGLAIGMASFLFFNGLDNGIPIGQRLSWCLN